MPANVYRRRPTSPASSHRGPTSPFNHCGNTNDAGCGSCAHLDGDYKAHLRGKYERALAQIPPDLLLGVPNLKPEFSPKDRGYRTHAKLAVRPGRGGHRFAIGMFRPGTHIVSEIAYCALHVRTINTLMRDLKTELEQSDITPFNETIGTGQLRYLSVRGHHQSNDLLITFVVNEPIKKQLRKIVDNLRASGHKVTGAHMNINKEPGNVIFGSETEKVWGADRMHETLCELDFGISPTSFFQVNPWQAERIYRRVEQITGRPHGDEVAWDLYCGIGQFSLVLARLGYRVLGAEENPAAIEDADGNAARNDLIQPRPVFVASRIEDYMDKFPAWAQSPSLVVANPSRRGLAADVRTLLADVLKRQPGSRLIYVSCEIQTLARDLEDLKKAGLRLRQLEAFDMFPFTEKLEWLAVVTS